MDSFTKKASSEEALTVDSHEIAAFASRVPLDRLDDAPLYLRAKQALKDERDAFRVETRAFTLFDWFAFYIPALGWLRTYNVRGWLLNDILAGLSVGMMVIPQGMSYAQNLAYLPQVYGLYGTFLPCIAYALLGSSRQLVVGPVAVTSLLLGNGLSNIFGNFEVNPSDPADGLQAALQERYNHAAIQVAFLAGVFYTAVGFLRLGWIINLISSAVVSGFMTGAGSIIFTGQIKYITGQKLPRADTAYDNLRLVFLNTGLFKWREFAMGGSFIVLLIAFMLISNYAKKSKNRYIRWMEFLKYAGPLCVCVISIAIMNIWKLYVKDPLDPNTPLIKPVGSIPKGFPAFTAPWWFPLYNVGKQLTLSVLVCLVDIVESTSIARALAQQNKYVLNNTQELRGLGLANLVGSMFNAYTTTGSFSRSAINNSVGAKTPLAQCVTGLMIMVTLLCLTPVFQNMSANTQGAIVLVGVIPLFDFKEIPYLWRVNKLDLLVWLTAFLVTFFLGAELGLAASVGCSIGLLVLKSAFPRLTPLGRLPSTDVYVGSKHYTTAQDAEPGVLQLRVEAPLVFVNAQHVREEVDERVRMNQLRGKQPIKVVLLDFSAVTDMDTTGTHILENLVNQLHLSDITLVVAAASDRALVMLQRARLLQLLGSQNIHINVADGARRANEVLQAEAAAKV